MLLEKYFRGLMCRITCADGDPVRAPCISIKKRRTTMQGKYLLCGLVGTTLAVGMTSTSIAAPAAATPATASSAYNQPPKEILDVMRAPAPPSPSLSPTRDKLMLVTMHDYP